MDAWLWIVVVVVVLVLLFLIFARRVVGGVDPTQLLLEPDLVGRVRALAQADQKIAAIKLLREGTPGLGLAAAKQMVDKMAAGPQTPPVDLAKSGTVSAADEAPSTSTVPLEVELQVRSLKSEGQAIQAIKLVREHTRWDLRTAKGYVDGL